MPQFALGRSRLVLSDLMAPDRNNFGVVRIAMALAVVVSHSFWLATGRGAADPLVGLTGRSIGEHAVQVFFFLSGILVTQSLLRAPAIVDFALARALRIFPGLIVCVLATTIIMGPLVTELPALAYWTDPQTYAYVLRTLSLSTGRAPLPGVFETLPLPEAVNISLWTLKYEVVCYVLLAAAGALALRHAERRRPATIVIALITLAIFVSEPKPLETYTAVDSLRYFWLFFGMGVLACLLRDALIVVPLLLLPLFALFVAAIGTRFAEFSSALFFGYATICFAAVPLGPLRQWAVRHDLSYGVYIYGSPVQQAIIWSWPGIGVGLLTVFSVLGSLLLAAASWHCVERPAIELRRPWGRWLARRQAALGTRRASTARGPQPAKSYQPSRPVRLRARAPTIAPR